MRESYGQRFWTGTRIKQANDVVVLVEDEEELQWLLKRLQSYVEDRGLKVNVEKTKMIRFRRRHERCGKVKCRNEDVGRCRKVMGLKRVKRWYTWDTE
ncbi:hypothetical protein KM043_007187 [Ampulex compressa]|nr:hypothetical protein KM043_007187 [Ampulex compressa]